MLARDDRILAHVRCLLEGPHFGVSFLLVERTGQVGYVPTVTYDTLFEEFLPITQPGAFEEACAAAADAASAAPPPRAFPCSSST